MGVMYCRRRLRVVSFSRCVSDAGSRLFDEKRFRGYGPYGYDVKELIARERAVRKRQR